MNLDNSIPFVEAQRTLAQARLNYSKIARELSVTPSHVRRVALGMSTSARVLKRLEQEWRRMERRSAASA